ncbi:DUF2239 family protein [Labrys wisconsinensis]|uniref:DUF2239 family protein n=1 Tax=Labrys wisconsinensis TaxID=425677 RepID=A0ABU0JLM1_9HYPH|nr:DUF2239 family protein [Labrys wisconsinensis]MDQ0475163.1 hypothetical protein [Labrys wisconsinensis]
MDEEAGETASCTAFAGERRIAAGPLREVARAAKAWLDGDDTASVLIFDDATSHPVEIDFRGTAADVLARLAPAEAPRRPGRPKLGVVAREVTLLPRHWDWLSAQPGGASVALRRLVEEARRRGEGADRVRRAQEAAYRFMAAMAGDRPGFEEAVRALFAGDGRRFTAEIASWPADLRDHAAKLAEPALAA